MLKQDLILDMNESDMNQNMNQNAIPFIDRY